MTFSEKLTLTKFDGISNNHDQYKLFVLHSTNGKFLKLFPILKLNLPPEDDVRLIGLMKLSRVTINLGTWKSKLAIVSIFGKVSKPANDFEDITDFWFLREKDWHEFTSFQGNHIWVSRPFKVTRWATPQKPKQVVWGYGISKGIEEIASGIYGGN